MRFVLWPVDHAGRRGIGGSGTSGMRRCGFYELIGGFPKIEEDELPYCLLCNEYPPAKQN